MLQSDLALPFNNHPHTTLTNPTMYTLVRPILFALDAEKAHHLTLESLNWAYQLGLITPKHNAAPEQSVQLMGLNFPNAVGLAAGLDKNGSYIDALSCLGFGHIEIGTITPRPQPGNPLPRMFRLPQARALINRMGFNNHGVQALIENVKRAHYSGILGINIGKNFDTPIDQAAEDYLICLRAVYTHAHYVTVNISSPNTQNLRQLQHSDELGILLSAIQAERQRLSDQHGRELPIAVKIAPDLDSQQIHAIADLLVTHKIDAVIATNTTIARDAVSGLTHAHEAGGLSGAPLKVAAQSVTTQLAQILQGALPIIGVGGIQTGPDATERINAGAQLIQVYTGLIYRGPALIDDCVQAIAREHASTSRH